MKITLEGRNIPRSQSGDPHFERMNYQGASDDEVEYNRGLAGGKPALLDVFSPAEITELVNRALYQLEYQKHAHRKRNAEERLKLAPIKRALKQLYPGTSFAKATDRMLEQSVLFVKEHPELIAGPQNEGDNE